MKRTIISLFAVALLIPSLALAQGQGIIKGGKIIDTKFVLINGFLVASTIFDVETTFAGMKPGVSEQNPLMRPFINAGRPATYAYLGGVTAGIVYVSYRMKKSTNPTIRKLWWVYPVVVTVSHAFVGGRNLRFVFD